VAPERTGPAHRHLRTVTVVAIVLAAVFAGIATGVLPGRVERPPAGAPVPAVPSPGPIAGASSPARGPAVRSAATARGPLPQRCPTRAQVLAAAADQQTAGAGTPIVFTGPSCGSGWSAAIVGIPGGRTNRIVLSRGPAGYATVVYQPTLARCPASLARMPAALRASVAC
jgi:hypothetical protein